MAHEGDELLSFVDEPADRHPLAARARPSWRVLVVDDDPDVHESTRFALADLEFEGRPLELLHAHSGQECLARLARESDIAVVLLDVVMEAGDAGLVTVNRIRGDLGLHNTRIILRTGQPGQAPEIDTIRRYDINDYKTKSELTRVKLFTTLTTAIRSYQQLCRLDENRRGLEQIVFASHDLMARDGLQGLASGVITQIASMLGIPAQGLVCAGTVDPPETIAPERLQIIAAAGCFSHLVQHPVSEIDDPLIVEQLTRCLRECRNLVTDRSVTLCFTGHEGARFAAFVDAPDDIGDVDRHLLEVFCANISLCADNIEMVGRLRELAYVDPMLGLPNRAALVQHVDRLIETDRGQGWTLALVDIDQFAETNDMFGHVHGDLLLGAITARLHGAMPHECMLARVSGDVFAIACHDEHAAPARIASLFDRPFEVDGVQRPVSVCIGLVRCDIGEGTGIELLSDAFIALKRAKLAGPGSHQFYTRSIGEETRAHTRILHDLQQALDGQSLHLVYQPQVSLASGQVVGLEALVRWQRDDGSMTRPDQFIPVAERSGMIVALGAWVLRNALAAMRQLAAANHGDLRMAINVSPVQLRDPAFLELVDRILAQNGPRAGQLEFEITESIAALGVERITSLLGEVRKRDIEIAIDDFGTGFSSLSCLDKLPVDRLKIDRSFVAGLGEQGTGGRIAEMIVPLGHCLGISVLAEGVETPGQADILRAMGCDEAQGYLFAKPMPLDSLLGWLQTRKVA